MVLPFTNAAFRTYQDGFSATDNALGLTIDKLVSGTISLGDAAATAIGGMNTKLGEALGALRTGVAEIGENVQGLEDGISKVADAMRQHADAISRVAKVGR